jgi:hypothetical protein
MLYCYHVHARQSNAMFYGPCRHPMTVWGAPDFDRRHKNHQTHKDQTWHTSLSRLHSCHV